jgi:hypothetical protein
MTHLATQPQPPRSWWLAIPETPPARRGHGLARRYRACWHNIDQALSEAPEYRRATVGPITECEQGRILAHSQWDCDRCCP